LYYTDGWKMNARALSLGVVVALGCVSLTQLACESVVPTSEPAGDAPRNATDVIAQGLRIPWALAFLPDGDIILTERPGHVRLFQVDEGLLDEPLLEVPDVAAQGEGGLLGVAVHPEYPELPYIYFYHTYSGGRGLANRVVRYSMSGNRLVDGRVLLDGIPGAAIHNGGRLKFGPDGFLYVTTGDASASERSQDPDSLAGKILRMTDDGAVPAGNPFPSSLVYSMGHRNPQGLTWDAEGRLWATEHGSSATDEVNLIQPGNNYGWPEIRGAETSVGMESPVLHSGGDTWAPSGLAYHDGSLFFAGLRGGGLYQVTLSSLTLEKHLDGQFGRLREAVVGPDGGLYLLTSNRDGRAIPGLSDDRLIRVDVESL
jgi:glucose/arabinose dehydrogenase